MTEEILKRIDALAQKLGVTAQYLWGALLKQSRVEAIQDTFLLLMCIVLIAACIVAIRWTWRSDDDLVDTCGPALIIGSSVAGILLFCWFISLATSIPTEFFNPEYFALQRIASLLK